MTTLARIPLTICLSPPLQFWSDPDAKKDLDVHITVAGGDKPGYVMRWPGASSLQRLHALTIAPARSFDEDFVRNFYGYLSSRVLAGKAPNPLQMFRFLDDADVILVAPLPGYNLWSRVGVIRAIGTFLNVVLGEYRICAAAAYNA